MDSIANEPKALSYAQVVAGTSATEDRGDYRIDTLREDNFTTWKWHMLMVLKAKGLRQCVESSTIEDSRLEAKAVALLASSLSVFNQQRVVNCSTAYEIWTALESNFENKSSTEKTMLLEAFHSYRITSIGRISKALGDIQAKAARLKAFGAAIDDMTIISVILKALPESMNVLGVCNSLLSISIYEMPILGTTRGAY